MVLALIVDNDKAARISLKYALHSIEDVNIFEANDKQEALDHINNRQFDVIFIDIDSFEPDGMQIIKLLREHSKQALIVCLSKDYAAENVRNASRHGADSFLEKPLHGNVLRLRFSTYKKLLEHNSIVGFEAGSISLFKEKIFDYSITFKITEESSLARFWEYFAKCDCESIADCISAIYEIGARILNDNKRFLIYVETSENYKYFTVYVPSIIGRLNISEDLAKTGLPFKVTDNKFSIKCMCESEDIKPDTAPALPVSNIPLEVKTNFTTQTKLQIFEFIDKDDLVELCDNITDLESSLSVLQYSSLNKNEVLMVADYFMKMSRLLVGYPETFTIASALSELGSTIENNADMFIEKSKQLASLFITFCGNLTDWRKAMFFDGAPSADFMDATITADAKTIANIILPQEKATEEEIDDIFNF